MELAIAAAEETTNRLGSATLGFRPLRLLVSGGASVRAHGVANATTASSNTGDDIGDAQISQREVGDLLNTSPPLQTQPANLNWSPVGGESAAVDLSIREIGSKAGAAGHRFRRTRRGSRSRGGGARAGGAGGGGNGAGGASSSAGGTSGACRARGCLLDEFSAHLLGSGGLGRRRDGRLRLSDHNHIATLKELDSFCLLNDLAIHNVDSVEVIRGSVGNVPFLNMLLVEASMLMLVVGSYGASHEAGGQSGLRKVLHPDQS